MNKNISDYYPPEDALLSDLRRPSVKTLEMIWAAYNGMARLQILPDWKISEIEFAFKVMFPPPAGLNLKSWDDDLDTSYNAEQIYRDYLPETKKEEALWVIRGLVCTALERN
jgi:hypothetical protein